MSFASILVPAFGAPQDGIALAAGIAMAKPFDGHVQLLAVHPYPSDAVPNVGVPLSLEVMQSIVRGQESHVRDMNTRLRDMLASLNACEGITVQRGRRENGVTCSFRSRYGDVEKTLIKSAALSDLVVFGAIAEIPSDASQVFLGILRDAQKPVLITKQAPSGRVRKIVVGWDGSTSAARAIRQTVPLLRRVEQVTVTSVVGDGRDAPGTESLSAYLARHGVRFACRKIFPGRLSAADAMLMEAQNEGADLIVGGGYGHDQLWEAFFGGATAGLLADPTVPILLVH